MRKNFPTIWRDLFRVDGNNDALAAEFFGPRADQIRRGERRGVDADFVRARFEHGAHVEHRANASTDRQRHETLVRRPLDDVHDRLPAMGAGRDVEKDHLIGSLLVVAEGQLDGIADIAQLARFRSAELNPPGDLTGGLGVTLREAA